jgi:hypothetical protein
MVFLDSSHPEQWERLGVKGMFDENQITLFKFRSIIADMGILGVYNEIMNPSSLDKNLPKEYQNRKMNLLLHSGDVYRRSLKENRINDNILSRAGRAKNLDSLPVLVFTANDQYGDAQVWYEMQKELKNLSTQGKHIYMDANHGSVITKKENAEIVNKEILLMAETLNQKSQS